MSTSSNPSLAFSALPILKPIGLIGSGILFGGTATISFFAIPTLLTSSRIQQLKSPTAPATTLLEQWRTVYALTSRSFPPFTLLTSLTYVGIGYLETSSSRALPWFGCAGLTIAIVPYTFGLMMSRIRRLQGTEAEGWMVKQVEEEVESWSRWNLGRAMFHVVAIMVGVREVARSGL